MKGRCEERGKGRGGEGVRRKGREREKKGGNREEMSRREGVPLNPCWEGKPFM